MATALDLVKEALQELRVLNATQDVSGEDSDYGLVKLNRLLDRWNANRGVLFAERKEPFTLTGALQPHTIGATGTFVTTRPTRILAASYVSGSSRYPINIQDAAWYQALTTPGESSTIPTDLYYEPAVPNGKIWFFPVPSAAASLELWTLTPFTALAIGDTLVAPQGYHDAIVKTLAEELQSPMGVPMPDDLPRQAREARSVITIGNVTIPAICTRDAGLGGGDGWFDYRTGVSS